MPEELSKVELSDTAYELEPVDTAAPAPTDVEDKDDLTAVIQLPDYSKITENRVIRGMQNVFPGFEVPTENSIESMGKDPAAIEEYIDQLQKDIVRGDLEEKSKIIESSAANSVRRWQLGYVIKSLTTSSKFSAEQEQGIRRVLHSHLGAAYYHYLKVGERLSIKDVYVLGMYDAGWGNIRSLAFVADADMRQLIIKSYCDSIVDWNDKRRRDAARKALSQAIKEAMAGGYDSLASSDPANLIATGEIEELAPEYKEALNLLEKLLKTFKKLGDENYIEQTCKTFSDYFIADDIEGAADLNQRVTEAAADLAELIENTQKQLPDLKEQLVSLAEVKPIHKEVDNEEAKES